MWWVVVGVAQVSKPIQFSKQTKGEEARSSPPPSTPPQQGLERQRTAPPSRGRPCALCPHVRRRHMQPAIVDECSLWFEACVEQQQRRKRAATRKQHRSAAAAANDKKRAASTKDAAAPPTQARCARSWTNVVTVTISMCVSPGACMELPLPFRFAGLPPLQCVDSAGCGLPAWSVSYV